jgi:hypothetical protein
LSILYRTRQKNSPAFCRGFNGATNTVISTEGITGAVSGFIGDLIVHKRKIPLCAEQGFIQLTNPCSCAILYMFYQ